MLIIFGAGNNGKNALEKLIGLVDKSTLLFCDNDTSKQGKKVSNVLVISFQDAQKYKDAYWIIASGAYEKMAEQLYQEGIFSFSIYIDGEFKKITDYHGGKVCTDYIQIRIVDNCNLNCKNCGSVCNKYVEPHCVDVEKYREDIIVLHQYISLIREIHLLGGEPLLHDKLSDICAITREYYPQSRIIIVTNGLLIDSLPKDILNAIRDNEIMISVSAYKPTMKKKEQICESLENANIAYAINPVVKFYKFRHCEYVQNNAQKAYEKCISKHCLNYNSGILSACAAMEGFSRLNSIFGTNFKFIEGKDYIDLYSDPDIMAFLNNDNNPRPLCGYCESDKIEWFDWKESDGRIELSDYVID